MIADDSKRSKGSKRNVKMAGSNFRSSFILLVTTLYSILFLTPSTGVVMVADAFTTDPSSITDPSTTKTTALSPTKNSPPKKATIKTSKYENLRQEWNERSFSYYSKILREEKRRISGQISDDVVASKEYQQDFEKLAKKHYFALRKIKEGRYDHAEIIYQRIIRDIFQEQKDVSESCDHAKLAVTTLLLALHCQRMGDPKKARSVFLRFFREVTRKNNINANDNGEDHHQCACSAKVLCAFALFEMRKGNKFKSLDIAHKAVQFDPTMEPLLKWKEFREVRERVRLRSSSKTPRRKNGPPTARTDYPHDYFQP